MATSVSPPEPARGEVLRPALHAFTGLGALLLAFLPYPAAIGCALLGVLAGWVVFPRTIERHLRRPGERFLGGLRTYPLAVLLLVLLLPPAEAAAAWAILAFGDVAAAVVGTRVRAPSLFGHRKATWAGTAALVLVGGLTAWGMGAAVGGLAAWADVVDPGPVPGLARCVLAVLAAAVVDLLPIPPDDNLPCAAAAGVVLRLTRGMM